MPPVNLLIKPASSLCNMRCKYCFYADVSDHRSVRSFGLMDEITLEALVKQALAYAEGSCTFAFQGGEPTMAGLDYFKAFAALLKKHNTRRVPVQLAIQTNGLVIDGEWAKFLAENRFLVGISMDGDALTHDSLRPDSEGKGTFARAENAARLLREYQCEYNILCVVTRPVARRAARIYKALREHKYLQFIPCIDDFDGPAGDFALDAAQYANFLKAVFDAYYRDYQGGNYVSVRNFDNYIHMLLGAPAENCAMNGVCTCNLVIEGDGSAYPCDFYVLDGWKLGNVREDALGDMIQSAKAGDFIAVSRKIEEECKACPWGALCRGGCRRDREYPGQSELGLNRFCAAYKDFFAYSLPRMREIATQEARYRGNGR